MMTKAETWSRISSEIVAECRVFDIRQDSCERSSDRKRADFYVIESPDWVNVIALTSDEGVVMIEQFRHGTGEINLELPGGLIDDGEETMAAAARELREETGFTSRNWILLGRSHPNPAIQSNAIYHYLALGCEKTRETEFDGNESIVTKLMSLSDVERSICEGAITHALVVAAFYYFTAYRNQNRL